MLRFPRNADGSGDEHGSSAIGAGGSYRPTVTPTGLIRYRHRSPFATAIPLKELLPTALRSNGQLVIQTGRQQVGNEEASFTSIWADLAGGSALINRAKRQ
jgi:hypothetical protein